MDDRQITTEPYRYGYQGQYAEKDSVTNWNAFELRMYDARFGRWLSPDPYGQFSSPYLAMGNNPVSGTDPNGGLCCLDFPLSVPIGDLGIPLIDMGTLSEVTVTASRIGSSTPFLSLITAALPQI